jgi:FtsH-binding integral membrane protein
MRKRLVTLLTFFIIFGVVNGIVMYLCLRVLHWNFFLSAFLASSIAVLSCSFLGVFPKRDESGPAS